MTLLADKINGKLKKKNTLLDLEITRCLPISIVK